MYSTNLKEIVKQMEENEAELLRINDGDLFIVVSKGNTAKELKRKFEEIEKEWECEEK